MKYSHTILILILAIGLQSCSNKTEKTELLLGSADENSALVSQIVYKNSSSVVSYDFEYNSKNQAVKITHKINGIQSEVNKIYYNTDSSIRRIEVFANDTLMYAEEFERFDENVVGTIYKKNKEDWSVHEKQAYNLNHLKQPTAIVDYEKDSNEVWNVKGSTYEMVWENNNIKTIKNYLVQSDPKQSMTVNNKPMVVFHKQKEYPVNIDVDFEEYFTSTIKYQDVKNPLYHLPFAKFIMPENFLVSKQIPSLNERVYKNNERVIAVTAVKEMNEKGYPIELTRNGMWVADQDTTTFLLDVYYKYLD